MWKSTSRGVTAKLRAVGQKGQQRCRVSTNTEGGAKQQQPGKSLKEVPNPGDIPPPATIRPQQSKRGGVFGKLVGLTLVGAGGAVGYAWYNQEFRNVVSDKVPYSKDVLDALFLYLPDSPSVPAPILDRPKKIEPVTSEESFYKKRTPAKVADSSESSAPKQEASPPPPAPEKKREPLPETSAERKEREREEARKRQQAKEAEIAAENAAMEVILENLMETCDNAVRDAIKLDEAVINTTKTHVDLLKTAMDDNSQILEKDTQWQSVSMAFEAREDAMKSAEKVVLSAKENLEKLRHAIDEGRLNAVTKKNKSLMNAKESLNKLSTELNKNLVQVAKVESESRVMLKYKNLVDKGKEQFKKELESIMPDVKIGKGRKLSEDELNALIAHAHKRIEQLQKQLAQQLATEQQTIQKSLEIKQEEDEKLSDESVRQAKQALQDEFVVEKDKWEADAHVQFEIELRRQLARQTAAHSEHLQQVLRVQEEDLNKKFEREVHLRLLEERDKFDDELSGWIARLRGIESAVSARAESEKTARQAQELWLACVALNGAIRVGSDAGETWEDQLRPLDKEVEAVFFAAKNNPFVSLILESIPEKALERGIYTEDNLKDRFWKVRKVAKRVALIDETGGTLFKYLLSYVQSMFIFNSVYAKEEKDEINIEEMDTFQILNHANYWLEKGDLEQALRFMNQLHGESRTVASEWIEEARLHLETRQASYTLMGFASATGLGTVF